MMKIERARIAGISSFSAKRRKTADIGMEHISGVRRQAGFSLLELILVVAIVAVIATIAVFGINAVLPGLRANQAMYQVSSSLREARMLAMSQKSNIGTDYNVCVQFISNDSIRVGIWNVSTSVCGAIGSASLNYNLSTMLERGHQFMWSSGHGEADAGFGSGSAVVFGGTAVIPGNPPLITLIFTKDGFLTKNSDMNSPVNGTIFIGHPNNDQARAVTILGTTGRIRTYQWRNGAWQAGKTS